jgi:hypothetical protein
MPDKWQSIQIFDLNRRDPTPGSGFRDRGGGGGGNFNNIVYPPAIRAAQITRSFASKGAVCQYDG